eukprot:Pgem_evm1s9557
MYFFSAIGMLSVASATIITSRNPENYFTPVCDGRGPQVISQGCLDYFYSSNTISNPQQDIMMQYLKDVKEVEIEQPINPNTDIYNMYGERNLLFVFIIHAPSDLDLMEYWMSPSSPIYKEHQHEYIVVPDQRLYSESNFELSKPYFDRWDSRPNIHVVASDYSIYGSWGGSSLVYKEIIGYLKAFELGLHFSHAILSSATALPLKTVDEMLQIYEEGTAYASIWEGLDSNYNKVERTNALFYDCGGCVYRVENKKKKTDVYNRVAPPALREWQNSILANKKSNGLLSMGSHPLAKGAQWKALTKELIYESLLGENRELFKEYLEFFETVWIPDEHFWPTYLKNEYIEKNYPRLELTEHVKSLWKVPKMAITTAFLNKKIKGQTRWELFRNDITTTHLRKMPPIYNTVQIVDKLFSIPYQPANYEKEVQTYKCKEYTALVSDLFYENVIKHFRPDCKA